MAACASPALPVSIPEGGCIPSTGVLVHAYKCRACKKWTSLGKKKKKSIKMHIGMPSAVFSIRRSPAGFPCQAGLVFLVPISPPEFSMGRWGRRMRELPGTHSKSVTEPGRPEGPRDPAQGTTHLGLLLPAAGSLRGAAGSEGRGGEGEGEGKAPSV